MFSCISPRGELNGFTGTFRNMAWFTGTGGLFRHYSPSLMKPSSVSGSSVYPSLSFKSHINPGFTIIAYLGGALRSGLTYSQVAVIRGFL